ncbi:MAG: DUF523 and DUF1722 domain-containing protein [Candidatus Omnitrophica bacterium]|nr:DUF523 and DUF1722 domain-containing protein [Candidatus Omnitrophota bacterium]MCB9720414.1 DUF523 and DUF1722 domain-containing protein [Candidatus Omnitrophota bacterium]
MTRTFAKPVIVVSKCLEFDKCRYNGAVIPAKFVRKITEYVRFLPVCPEVEIGLGIPRDPIKLIGADDELRLYQPSTRLDLTARMNRFNRQFLGGLEEVDGFILKFGSPSCALKDAKMYNDELNPIVTGKGPGMFAAAVLERFPGLAVEDEGRLSNFRLREHFLTKVFMLADFRRVRQLGRLHGLVDFHARHKLMLMAYSQKHLRLMGRLVAGANGARMPRVMGEYQSHLFEAFARYARYTSHINVLMHALGYFKKEATTREKAHFLGLLDKFRAERLPLSAILAVLHSWSLKYNKEYLLGQTYFEPYPEELIEISDSGLGRNTRY